MSIKIGLDTAALERLIGGDSEIEFKLRSSIVQHFAQRHLKCIAKESAFQKTLDEIKSAIINEFRKQIPLKRREIKQNWSTTFEWWLDTDNSFCQKLAEAIESAVKERAETLIEERINAVWSDVLEKAEQRIERVRLKLLGAIQEEVSKQVTQQFEKTVQLEVNRRIKAAFQALKQEEEAAATA